MATVRGACLAFVIHHGEDLVAGGGLGAAPPNVLARGFGYAARCSSGLSGTVAFLRLGGAAWVPACLHGCTSCFYRHLFSALHVACLGWKTN